MNETEQEVCFKEVEEHKDTIRDLEGERTDIANALVIIDRGL